MNKSILNTVVALTVLSSTFGAYSVYQSNSGQNFRGLSSVENPVLIVDSISAEVIQEQKIRIEEVTIEMKKANGDMITLKKRIIEIEQKLSKKVNRATAILNLGNLQALRSELKDLNSQKASLESSITSIKSKHKKAIAGLKSTNKKLAAQIDKSKQSTESLKNKISELERSGIANSEEINQLKLQVEAEESNTLALANQINDLGSEVANKQVEIAKAIKLNKEISENVVELNDLIFMLNDEMASKDEKISQLDISVQTLTSEQDALIIQKDELDKNKAELLAQATEQAEVIKAKEDEIKLQQNQIACQAEEIKVNTTTITQLQEQVKKSTDAIKESSDAIKSFKVERDERKEKVVKLEKENKKYKEEQKGFDSIIQMMMSKFMMMPQMMRPQQQPAMHNFSNPLAQFSMSDMYMMKMLQGGGANGLGKTGLPMFDPYASPSVINNNYYQQETPYGGNNNDFNVRDMYKSSDRSPSGYYQF